MITALGYGWLYNSFQKPTGRHPACHHWSKWEDHDADGDTQQLKYQLQRPGRDLKAELLKEKEDFVATKNDYNGLLLHNFNFSINNRNRAS